LKKLGRILKDRRNDLRMTLRDVEKTTGISNAYLSQLENDKISQPTPKILRSLSDCYDLSFQNLLTLAGHPIFEEKIVSRSRTSVFDSITAEEENELKQYLRFLRSRGRSK